MADREDQITETLLQRLLDGLKADFSVSVILAGVPGQINVRNADSSEGLLKLGITETKDWHVRETDLRVVIIEEALDGSDVAVEPTVENRVYGRP